MIRLILILALQGQQWAQEACEQIGGEVHSISVESRMWEALGYRELEFDLTTIQLELHGYIS